MTATQESYERAARKMMAAAMAWKTLNPDAKLKFVPLNLDHIPQTRGANVVVISPLSRSVIRSVGDNPKTRELLTAMDAAIGNEGTVMQAEFCIEQVFGIKNALTRQPSEPEPVDA